MLFKLGPIVIATTGEFKKYRKQVANDVVLLTIDCEDLATPKIKAALRRVKAFRRNVDAINAANGL